MFHVLPQLNLIINKVGGVIPFEYPKCLVVPVVLFMRGQSDMKTPIKWP